MTYRYLVSICLCSYSYCAWQPETSTRSLEHSARVFLQRSSKISRAHFFCSMCVLTQTIGQLWSRPEEVPACTFDDAAVGPP
jgi:hypothetical protein